LGIEPLFEKDPNLRNPDAIVGNPERDLLVTIECKTGLSSPQSALQQIREAAENILQNSDYLKKKAGVDFNRLERVLLVPGRIGRKARDAIDEENNHNPPIYLWEFYTFDEEALLLRKDFRTRSESDSTHNSRISQYLSGDGISVENEHLSGGSFFPESSYYKMVAEIFIQLTSMRDSSSESAQMFTKEEVHRTISDPRVMTHYSISEVADYLCEDLIDKMLHYDLIAERNPEDWELSENTSLYTYLVNGKNPDTIVTNLKKKYMQEWEERTAEKDAKKEIVDQYMGPQSSLDSF